MASTENAVELVKAFKRAGVNFIASLPDASLAPLIGVIDETNSIMHVPLSREEEGVGVCSGAYMGGKRCMLLMQNAGLLNTCNALTTTAVQFQFPMLLVVLYAGTLGDMAFPQLGQATEPVLAALNIPTYVLDDLDDAHDLFAGAMIQSYNVSKPVAILITKRVL